MCLTSYNDEFKEFKEKNKNKEFIYCYKVIDWVFLSKYRIVYKRGGVYKTPFTNIEVSPVTNKEFKSNVTKEDKEKYSRYSKGNKGCYPVTRGVHVYTVKNRAEDVAKSYDTLCCKRHIFRVKCYLKDMLGYDKIAHEAAFSKVTWDKKVK